MIEMEKEFKLYPGRHEAEFLGVEKREYEYGPCLFWKFCITHGLNRTFVTRITGLIPTPGSFCEMMLSGLLGGPVLESDLLYVHSRMGDLYSIDVRYHKGYPQVKSVESASNYMYRQLLKGGDGQKH